MQPEGSTSHPSQVSSKGAGRNKDAAGLGPELLVRARGQMGHP